MYISLLVLGLLLTAGGFVTVGFGIPINAFSLGNTLIIAGTVCVTGGLVLIGLASAVRQLARIAEALRTDKPLPARVSRQAEAAVEAALVPPPARMAAAPQPPAPQPPAPPTPSPVPTRSVQRPMEPPMPRAPEPRVGEPRIGEPGMGEPRLNEPRIGEPRVDGQRRPAEPKFGPAREPRAPIEPRFQAAAPSPEPAPRGPLDWLRPKSKAATAPIEPPVVEVADEAPLSPRTPRGAPSPLATMAEPLQEPKAWAPRADDGFEPRADLRAGAPRAERIARTPQDEAADHESPVRDKRLFDAMWPDAKPRRAAEALKAADPKLAEVDPPAEEAKPVEAKSKAEPTEAAPDNRRESDRVAHPEARKEPQLALASERPIAVLKSGVIDGMAYTLYADGSIEAELAQGKVKFGSVDALRAHLEKSA
jgi:hypothetical protein